MADVDLQIVTNIEGLDELEKALLEGGPKAAKRFMRSVEMKAAKVLQDSASESAPFHTGDLSEDIKRQTIAADDTLTVRVGPSRETFYGLFQEFGAPEAGVPAQHWLESSAKEAQDAVLEKYIEAVNEGLEEMKG